MTRSYTRGANRSRQTGGGSVVSAGFGYGYRKLVDFRKNFGGKPKRDPSTRLPKRIAKACGTATGLMNGERARKKQAQQAEERRAVAVPRGHKRITRGDHTLDVPITQRQLDMVLVGRLYHRSVKNVPEWVINFIRHGELPK